MVTCQKKWEGGGRCYTPTHPAQHALVYRLQFIDTARLTARSLLNLVNNLAEGIRKIKCKFGHDDKKCESCGIRYNDCDS